MKKKQLAKLKQQFRPSFNQARVQLFREMEKQAAAAYDLPVKVSVKFDTPHEMSIEFLGETTRDQVIAVPLDEHFNLVIKRIQMSEAGLLTRFSRKLVDEFASYWGATPEQEASTEAVAEVVIPAKEVAPVVEEIEVVEKVIEKPIAEEVIIEEETIAEVATGDLTLDSFKTAIKAFPKFDVIEAADNIQVIEKTAKEDRLLATISTTEKNSFTIEAALERKYKLKLEVIPVIEAFAASIA